MKQCLRYLIFFLLVASALKARGHNTAALLETSGSASQAALAGTGKTADIAQMFFNPAVLHEGIDGRMFSLSWMSGGDFGTNSFFGGYAWPAFEKHRFAFSLSYLRNSDLLSVSEQGVVTGKFSTVEMLGGFSHNWSPLPNLYFGETLKVYYFDYDVAKTGAYSLDVGTLYHPLNWFSLGLSFYNLFASEYHFVAQSEVLPAGLELQPSVALLDGRLKIHYVLRQNFPLYQETRYEIESRAGFEFDVYRRYFTLMASVAPQGTGFGFASEVQQYRFAMAWQPLPFETRITGTLTFNIDTVSAGPFRRPASIAGTDIEQELAEFHEAMQLYNSGDYKEAYDKFGQVLRMNPDHQMSALYRDRALLHLRNTDFLDQEQEKLIKMHKEMALRYENQNNFGEAIHEWRKVLEINPVDIEAEPNIDRIKRRVNDRVLALHRQGLEQYRANDILKSIDSFSEALRFNPEYEPSKNWLLKIKQEMSQEELRERERIERLQKAEVFYNRGLSYYGRKTFEESVREFDQALALNPNHENAKKYRQLAAEELEAERLGLKGLEAAKKLYEKGMKNFNSSQFYQAKKDFAAAVRAFPAHEESAAMLPRAEERLRLQVKPFIADGIANYRKKRFSVATENFQNAIQLDPENTEAKEYIEKLARERDAAIAFHNTEGNRAFERNEFSKAIYHYDEAVKLDPNNTQAAAKLAAAREKVKATVDKMHSEAMAEFSAEKYDTAITIWNKVLEIDAANKLAERYIKEAELKKKASRSSTLVEGYNKRGIELFQNRDFEQALSFFSKALGEDPRNTVALQYKEMCEQELAREQNQEQVAKLFIEGVREYKKREYEKAILKWREVKKLDPQNTIVDKYIAQATDAQKNRKLIDFINGQKFYEQGKWLLAKASFERAVQENPQNAKARSMLQDTLDRIAEERTSLINEGDRKMRAGQYIEAANDYLAAYRLDNSAESQLKRENAIKAQEQFELGLRYFNSEQEIGLSIEPFLKVLEINPFDTRASDYINKAKEAGKTRIASWMEQAARAEESKDFRRAYALYRSVQEIDPANAEMKKGISRSRRELRSQAAVPYKEGKEAMALKNYALAVENFTKVLDLVSDYEDTQDLLQTARQELAKRRAAAANAASSGGTTAASEADNELINQGIVLYRQGKYQEAIATWQKVPRSSEAYSKAQKYIARARLKQ